MFNMVLAEEKVEKQLSEALFQYGFLGLEGNRLGRSWSALNG